MPIDPLTALGVKYATEISAKWLKPALSKVTNEMGQAIDLTIHDFFVNAFQDYLSRSFEKQRYLKTIALPNQKKTLDELYVPATLIRPNCNDQITIDKYPSDLISLHKDVLIVDTAGMGKSTVMKFLFLDAIEKNIGIPIFIELRKLSKERKPLDFIFQELSSIQNELNRQLVFNLIAEGDFIFFLDGYDEISVSDREIVTADLQEFKAKANGNSFIMTSRDESGLVAFSEFMRFNIRAFNESEAYLLINKYGVGGQHAAKLIEKLNSTADGSIKEFLSNPLLVSLLYKAYEYEPILPSKKHIFYRQVYDALFQQHDLSKDGGEFTRRKKSGLDIDQFHTVLRATGFVTIQAGRLEYTYDEFLNIFLSKAEERCAGIKFPHADMLNDLINQVPLFVKDGNYVRWAHKSLQEYFSAQYICVDAKGKQSEILKSIFESTQIGNYQNLLQLCYDIDYKTFRHTLILGVLKDVLSDVDASYADIDRTKISENQIIERKNVTAFFHIIFLRMDASHNVPRHELHQRALELMNEASELAKKNGITVGSTSTRLSDPSLYLIIRRKYFQFIESMQGKQGFEFMCRYSPHTQIPESVNWPDVMTFLDDKPLNPLNSLALFDNVTNLIKSMVTTGVDIQVCKDELEKIEREIKVESETTYLFL